MEVVVAEAVCRRYGEVVALDGVSLRVAAGEAFALIGPNGAGKTTLVRALTGTTAARGHIEVLGAPPAAVEKSRIGLLPQAFGPPARLTARELLAYYGGLYDEARDAEAVLADVGLAGAADTRYEDLSGGQQRRVCVGTALAHEPDLLFLDEPTTGIDPAGRRALWDLLEGLVAGGTTVVLTTHDMAEAERLADRVGLLADGDLVAVGTPAELVEEYGGDSHLAVETDGVGAGAAALREAGHRVEVADGRLVVRGVAPEDIGGVVAELEAAGVESGALTWSEPGLEDVYLRLTGTAVAEGGEPIERGAATGTAADGRAGEDGP